MKKLLVLCNLFFAMALCLSGCSMGPPGGGSLDYVLTENTTNFQGVSLQNDPQIFVFDVVMEAELTKNAVIEQSEVELCSQWRVSTSLILKEPINGYDIYSVKDLAGYLDAPQYFLKVYTNIYDEEGNRQMVSGAEGFSPKSRGFL